MSEQNVEKSINPELFNRFMMAFTNNNSSLSRGNALQQLLDPRRNYDDEFGYPATESLVAEDYKRLYDRNPIAARVVDVLPSECWQNTPDVYEDDDLETETEFEKAWDELAKRLRGEQSWFQDQEGNPVWEYLARADKLSRIGHFGVIVLGLNDGLPLSEPPRGFKESGSVPSGEFGARTYAEEDDPLRMREKRRAFVQNRHVSGNEPDKEKLTANVAAALDNNRFPKYEIVGNNCGTGGGGFKPGNKCGGKKSGGGKGGKGKGGGTVPDDGLVFHGTSTEAAESILKEGLRLDKSQHPEIWGGPKDIAMAYGAQNSSGWVDDDTYVEPKDGTFAVIGISSKHFKQEGGAGTSSKDIPPSAIKKIEFYKMVENKAGNGPLYVPDKTPFKTLTNNEEGDDLWVPLAIVPKKVATNQEKPKGTKNELAYLRVFDESQVDIVRYEMNQASPRYGWPVEYSICFNDPSINMSTRGGIGIPLMTQKVHWARVIHIADNLDSSELFGVPAQRPVLNNLLNIHKVYGGDAEGFFRGAIMSHSVETHPQLGPDAVIDWNVMRDQYEQFINGVQRIFGMSGAALKSHAPAVVDPTSHINIQVEAICIKLEIPKRVFMGSERGELASSQDKDTWGQRKEKRRQNYITPRIIIPFIDRLILLGVLPQPEGYSVFWPDTEEMTETEKSAVLVQRVDGMSKYIGGGVEALMTPKDFLSREMGYTEEDADAILEAAADATDDEDTYTPVEDPNAEPEPIPGFPPKGTEKANTDAVEGVTSGGKKPIPVPSNNELTENNCGIGGGGFKPGNKCAKGGGGRGISVSGNTIEISPQQYLELAMPFGHDGGREADKSNVSKLAAMDSWDSNPMLSVKETGEGLQVGLHDGRHRALAAIQRGDKTIKVDIVRGRKFARENPDVTDADLASRVAKEGLRTEVGDKKINWE